MKTKNNIIETLPIHTHDDDQRQYLVLALWQQMTSLGGFQVPSRRIGWILYVYIQYPCHPPQQSTCVINKSQQGNDDYGRSIGLLFGEYCRTCNLGIFEPQCEIVLLQQSYNHCIESKPLCFDMILAWVWLQSPCQISPTLLTYHRLILSRGGKHTGNVLASLPSNSCVWCVRMA